MLSTKKSEFEALVRRTMKGGKFFNREFKCVIKNEPKKWYF